MNLKEPLHRIQKMMRNNRKYKESFSDDSSSEEWETTSSDSDSEDISEPFDDSDSSQDPPSSSDDPSSADSSTESSASEDSEGTYEPSSDSCDSYNDKDSDSDSSSYASSDDLSESTSSDSDSSSYASSDDLSEFTSSDSDSEDIREPFDDSESSQNPPSSSYASSEKYEPPSDSNSCVSSNEELIEETLSRYNDEDIQHLNPKNKKFKMTFKGKKYHQYVLELITFLGSDIGSLYCYYNNKNYPGTRRDLYGFPNTPVLDNQTLRKSLNNLATSQFDRLIINFRVIDEGLSTDGEEIRECNYHPRIRNRNRNKGIRSTQENSNMNGSKGTKIQQVVLSNSKGLEPQKDYSQKDYKTGKFPSGKVHQIINIDIHLD